MEKDKLLNLQTKLNYIFNNPQLLKMALTHKSYAYEKVNPDYDMYNERIEFLGDAILEHIISDLLFSQVPELSEGQMTKKRAAIVCEASLSSALKRINGHEYIYLGKCEQNSNGKMKDAIVADAFEAILGAIYLDGGYEIARDICLELLDKEIKTVLEGGNLNTDYKTQLQEILQRNGTVKIEYKLQKEEGPEHDKLFTIDLYFNGKKIGQGQGKSKKHAEQEAAHNAIINGGDFFGN
jgi:ribonuclease-3